MKDFIAFGVGTGIMLGTLMTAVHAQTATAPAEESETTGLEAITVTARKRGENLLDVPVTVTAITSADIATRDITDLLSVTDFTPSFSIANAGGTQTGREVSTLTIRGIRAASLFIDGAPATSGIVDNIADLDRVEILKGPQAAYYGRATFSGAVNLVTKTPTNDLAGTVDIKEGGYGLSNINASISGALIPNILKASLSIRDYSFGGQYKNYATEGSGGGTEQWLGAQSTKSYSLGLSATPIDGLRIKFYGTVWSDSDGAPAIAQYGTKYYNCNANVANPGGPNNYVCGTLPNYNLHDVASVTPVDALFTNTVLNNSLGIMTSTFGRNYPYIDHGGLELRAYHTGLSVDYDIPGLNATLSYIGSLNGDSWSEIADYGGQPLGGPLTGANPNYPSTPDTEPYINWMFYLQTHQVDRSHELRLTSAQDQRFRWVVGASYLFQQYQLSAQALVPYGPQQYVYPAPNLTATTGAFVGLSYDIFPKLTLDLEGRYQWDHLSLYSFDANRVENFVYSNTYNNFVPRINLSYKLTPDIMLYALYSEGINPGTFNSGLLNAYPFQLTAFADQGAKLVVNPEKLFNYELGVKGKFWDNRLQVTAAAYYATWKDQIVDQSVQVQQANAAGQPIPGYTVIDVSENIGKTVVDGLELEAQLVPIEHVTLELAAALNHTDIKSFVCLQCVATTGTENANNNSLPDQPKWTTSLGAQYRNALTADLDWYTRADFIYKSGEWDNYENVAITPATKRTNLRGGIQNRSYRVEVFVENLTNNLAVTSPENNVSVLSPTFTDYLVNAALPLKREFGIRGTYKW